MPDQHITELKNMFRISNLLRSGDAARIGNYYRYMDNIAFLKRSSFSKLLIDDSETLDLGKLMPQYTVGTRTLHYEDDEIEYVLWLHRILAQ